MDLRGDVSLFLEVEFGVPDCGCRFPGFRLYSQGLLLCRWGVIAVGSI